MITICGVGQGFKHGNCLVQAAFKELRSICLDPINPGCYYVGDLTSIRYCTPDTVELIAGAEAAGFADGAGAAVRFNYVFGLVATSDGKKLYAADHLNHRIRSIDTTTRTVTTIAGTRTSGAVDGLPPFATLSFPSKLCFDRSRTALFITSISDIRRFEFGTGRLSTIWTNSDPTFKFFPSGIAITGSGHLIVGSMESSCVCSFDPDSGNFDILAGRGGGGGARERKSAASDLAVVEHERCAYVADNRSSCVRRITLPDSLFTSN